MKIVNMLITYIAIILTGCYPFLKDSNVDFTEELNKLQINGRNYECWNPKDLKNDSFEILYEFSVLTKKDLPDDIKIIHKKLQDNKVKICYLPMSIYKEFCDKIIAVGCYYPTTHIIWLTGNALVHELLHHYIYITDPNGQNLSHEHTHPFQQKYEIKVQKEFGL